jgi:hypothetical protein
MIGVGHTWFTEEMAKRLEIGSRMTGKRVTTLVNIIDIAKVGLGARKMLKIFATTSYIDQNFYPEELGCMYLINAPSFFPVLYSICKGFLSAKTQEKIRILGSNYKPVLVEELGAECLPEEYGGTCKCEGGCCPLATGPGYVRPGEEDAEEENLTLKAGAKKTIEIPYAPTVPRGEEEGGGEIAQEAYWSIEVPSRDVDLTVSFRPASNESNAESVDETPLTEVKPTERLASSGTAYTGVYSGATSGVIVLTVSNEYARWHTKTAKIRSGTRTASKKQVA